ncbi:DUF6111 family protein [Hyphomicrobium sp.]|uniref:DUF6111 family protein n=1 Tax=Hyphomicrobium sp. TaxID=82 RepID=UPI0025BEA281|nr:DUF6111 family protein [Hyphomicrobium sp.]MCC7252058.1 hypothetical protein [Hyphomicrobium sp.]
MIRTVIENLLLFLLPTALYVAWVLFQRSRKETQEGETQEEADASWMAHVLDDAPLLWLFASGALLVIVTLIAFGTSSGGKPGQHYQPSILKDGKIQPSHIE